MRSCPSTSGRGPMPTQRSASYLSRPPATCRGGATSNPVTLGRVLVHVTAETHRHAGHADIVRELIDGNVGHREGNDNMAGGDQTWWREYRDHLESIARRHPGPEPTAPC